MTLAGNICAALTVVALLILLAGVSISKSNTEIQYTALLLSIPIFLLFAGTYCAITAAGKLDWLSWPRGMQYVAVILSCFSLCTIMCGSLALRGEPANQVPWGLRPFVPWAVIPVPLILITIAFLWLNGPELPWLRGVFGTLSAIGLLTGVALLGEALYWNQKRELARVDAIQSRESERDRTILAEVQAADPEKDFGSLLNQTNRFEFAPIRDLALQKLRSNGYKFTPLLATHLRNVHHSGALTFLRDNDPPDPAALAEPIRDAIGLAAANVRQLIQTESTIRPDDFQFDAERVLSVADKYSKYVDLVPAVREFRAALDEPRPRNDKPELACRKTVDAWLAGKR